METIFLQAGSVLNMLQVYDSMANYDYDCDNSKGEKMLFQLSSDNIIGLNMRVIDNHILNVLYCYITFDIMTVGFMHQIV